MNQVLVFPTSCGQQRVWFLEQLEPGSSVHNIPTCVRLTGPLNVAALEQSFNEIVRRHESLRTAFAVVDGEPVQVIAPELTVALPIVDLSEVSEAEREGHVRMLAAEETRRPFDLRQSPLLRAKLLRLREQEHVLVLTMHHIISDGWSLGVLFRELSTLYEGFCQGKAVPLAKLPIQYADFAVWQRQWLQGEVPEQQLDYWKQQLEGLPILQLTTDRPRPALQTYRGAYQSLTLTKSLTDALKTLSRKETVTLFMTLLAAFQTLLHRYSGQDDIVVGSPIAGRTWAETEGLIGFFVNALVLRGNLSGNPTFRELLQRMREICMGAYANQDLPFEKLVEELQPRRDLSRPPLFQVFFNMIELGGDGTLNLRGLTGERLEYYEPTSRFDLTLYARDKNEGLWFLLVYNPDLFEPATIIRMLGHYQTLLEAIAANPRQPISSLPLLTAAERNQHSARRNRIAPTNPFVEFKKEDVEQSIPNRFDRQVKTHPHHIAIKTKNYQWTYHELDQTANRIAQTILRSCGRGEGRITLLFEHDAPMIAAILGVLKAGKAYVPLDPAYPAERLAYILADSQASAVLTNDENMVLTKTSTNGTRQINIDAIDHAGSIENLIVPISPDALVYILYTSGSTGRPKGVMQNHRNVLHHIRNYTNNLHLNPADRLILLSTYSFDAAIMDIFGALLNGATLYPIDVKQETPEAIAAWLSDQEITVYHSTPAIYRYFLTFLTSKKDLSAIRLVVLGGEEVQKKDVDLFKRYFSPQSILVNGLGPTESTLALQYFINHETQITGNTVPVGYPVDGTAVLLLNEAGADAEIHGEIAIRSEHVALGYWEKPEMTRAAFLADPEGGTKRIYRTGDMGRLLHDGSIAFSGRKDSQVKIRGYRIELGEIEAVLGQHPAVQETVVVSREDVDGDKRLIAYIVPTQEQDLTVSALRSFLKSKLPECMVPSTFMFLDALPLTSHGKVDHQGLPDPQSDATKTGYEFVEPRDETERVLCRIWAETLKLDRVGIDDDFFAVGGHSLLAAKLFSRLDEQFGRSLPLGVLFSAPTVRALAEHYRSEPQKQFRAMVALRKTGTLPPVFAVPGVFGNVVGFAELCRELGPEQPFYGLQSVGLDGSEVPLTSIEEMAKLNISELFTVQPRGPYAIIGACFGATVAYEMARQLLADGHEVLFLGLLDPSAREGREANEDLGASPRILRRAAALGSLVTNRLLLYLDELNRLNGKNRLKFIAGKLSSLSESLKHVHGFKGVQRELNQIEVFRANLNAFDHYQRKRLIGRLRTMEIFETARRVNDSWCDIVDWGNFSENAIHRHMVPGKDSGQMLTGENCRVVALLLAERLRTAITRD